MFILLVTDSFSQITIGTRVMESNATSISPYNSFRKSRRIQIVYTAAEIIAAGGVAGNITAIGWDISELTNITLKNYVIKMALTTATDVSTHNNATLTTVKSAFDFKRPASTGWRTINFDTPFTWDGVKNVLIDICWGMDTSYTGKGKVWLYNIVSNQIRDTNSNYGNLCGQITSSTLYGKPRVQLTMQTANCLPPQDLGVNNITSTSADLFWTTGGSATHWNVEYGNSGFTPGTGTYILNANNPQQLTGLIPEHSYDFYVRDSCTPVDKSAWVGPYNFTTLCDPITVFPYNEGFELSAFPPHCWTSNNKYGYGTIWSRVTSGNYPICSPHNGVGMANFNSYDNYNGIIAYLTTAPINIPDDEYEISFWMYRDDAYVTNHDSITVFINSTPKVDQYAVNLIGVNRCLGLTPVEASMGWHKYTAHLGSGSTGIKYIIFEGYSGYGYNIFIDDISIHEIPPCSEPKNLMASNITMNSADLSWTTGGSLHWNLEYGETGFTPGTGIYLKDPSNSINITGLLPGTSYQFYVRDSCNATDLSAWVGPYNFSTLCTPSTSFPYTEGFESVTFPPQCWTSKLISGSGTIWSRVTTGTDPTCSPHTGVGMAKFNSFDNNDGVIAYLATNSIVFPDTSYVVSFWMYRDSKYSSAYDSLAVYINNTPDLNGTPKELINVTRNTELYPVVSADGWYKYFAHIGAGSVGTKYIVFEGYSGYGNNIYIDDVVVEEIPICEEPINLVATNITQHSVKLNWTTNSGATKWNLEYGNNGFTHGTGTFIHNATNPITITGLITNHIYQFYVSDSCTASDTSLWAGPITFKTSDTCYMATNLSSSNITTNSAVLSWTTVSGVTYKLEYGNQGFAVGSGTVINPVVSPKNLTGLLSNHAYDFYITAFCSDGGTSSPSGPATFTTNTPVGIYEIPKDSYKIYPNPTTDKFYIYSDNIDKVQVYDITGKMITNINIENSDKPAVVDLSGQSKGIYIIRLFSGDKVSFEKIAKQ